MVSRDQGCPNASLEAMSCGLPVVANDDGGTAEQVLDGVTGVLVSDPGDSGDPGGFAEALAAALADLLRHPERARAMGEAARRHVAAQFSMAAMAEAYQRVLLV
jgi:starch synthase